MTNQEIIKALRCSASIHEEGPDCVGCPYAYMEKIPEEFREMCGGRTVWEDCDTDRICLDAADRLEALTRLGAAYFLIQDDPEIYPETNGWYIAEDTVKGSCTDGLIFPTKVDGSGMHVIPWEEIGTDVFMTRAGAEAEMRRRMKGGADDD